MSSTIRTARDLLASGQVSVLVSDLDGVLRHFDPDLWDRLDRELGLESGSTFRAILGSPYLGEVTHGRGTHARWREHAVEDLVADGADPAAARAAVDTWASTPARVDEKVAGLLREAMSEGVPVFVFTNGSDRVPQEMAQLGLDEFTAPEWSHLLNSPDLGVTKPSVEAFAAAHRVIEQRLGRTVPPDAVLFLDDSASHVAGAREFGWRAERYRGTGRPG